MKNKTTIMIKCNVKFYKYTYIDDKRLNKRIYSINYIIYYNIDYCISIFYF